MEIVRGTEGDHTAACVSVIRFKTPLQPEKYSCSYKLYNIFSIHVVQYYVYISYVIINAVPSITISLFPVSPLIITTISSTIGALVRRF